LEFAWRRAQRGPIVWMVLRQVIVMAAVGLAISVPIALGTSKFVGSLLFGMKPNDPLALGLAVMILIAGGAGSGRSAGAAGSADRSHDGLAT
jgi:ABC-type antimicrobial peptide transport system permease subunit